MNVEKTGISLCIIGIFVLSFLAFSSVQASTLRTQVVSLHKGWNAVFLQVTPTNSDPAAVFANTPVSQVAIYFDINSSVQFIQNPGGISWKKDGWAVWYAPNRSDAFLSNLYSINGNKSYLIYSDQDYSAAIIGNVTFEVPKWKPNSFNFTGFSVSGQSPPTFDKYFAGSAAHHPYRIYRLVNDQWTLVANPSTTSMRAGEACWVYCSGASDYQGPLAIKLTSGQGITFNGTGQTAITLANSTPDPLNIQVDTMANDIGVPLGYVVRGITTGGIVNATFDLPAHYSPPALEAGQSSGLWLKLRQEKMTATTQSTLLKISSDSGAEIWVPVTGNANP